MPRPTAMSAKDPVEVIIASDLAEARRVETLVVEALLAYAYCEHGIFSIKLALEEALVNAIKHGNQLDPDKRVVVSYQVTTERVDIWITDEGPGFNPDEVPDPTAIENIERPCGRGLLLMRGFMNGVHYNGKGNTVHMWKVKDGPPPTSL
jgi:serine/threonine-protein kinase RsbW